MSKRVPGIVLIIAGIGLGLLSLMADALGLDAPGSFSLAQVQGIFLALLAVLGGLYLFFTPPAPDDFSGPTQPGFLRLDGLTQVELHEAWPGATPPVAGQLPVEILDPRMLEQQPRFVPGQAWRVIQRDDPKGGG